MLRNIHLRKVSFPPTTCIHKETEREREAEGERKRERDNQRERTRERVIQTERET